jgi:hypothetical protein
MRASGSPDSGKILTHRQKTNKRVIEHSDESHNDCDATVHKPGLRQVDSGQVRESANGSPIWTSQETQAAEHHLRPRAGAHFPKLARSVAAPTFRELGKLMGTGNL